MQSSNNNFLSLAIDEYILSLFPAIDSVLFSFFTRLDKSINNLFIRIIFFSNDIYLINSWLPVDKINVGRLKKTGTGLGNSIGLEKVIRNAIVDYENLYHNLARKEHKINFSTFLMMNYPIDVVDLNKFDNTNPFRSSTLITLSNLMYGASKMACIASHLDMDYLWLSNVFEIKESLQLCEERFITDCNK